MFLRINVFCVLLLGLCLPRVLGAEKLSQKVETEETPLSRHLRGGEVIADPELEKRVAEEEARSRRFSMTKEEVDAIERVKAFVEEVYAEARAKTESFTSESKKHHDEILEGIREILEKRKECDLLIKTAETISIERTAETLSFDAQAVDILEHAKLVKASKECLAEVKRLEAANDVKRKAFNDLFNKVSEEASVASQCEMWRRSSASFSWIFAGSKAEFHYLIESPSMPEDKSTSLPQSVIAVATDRGNRGRSEARRNRDSK